MPLRTGESNVKSRKKQFVVEDNRCNCNPDDKLA